MECKSWLDGPEMLRNGDSPVKSETELVGNVHYDGELKQKSLSVNLEMQKYESANTGVDNDLHNNEVLNVKLLNWNLGVKDYESFNKEMVNDAFNDAFNDEVLTFN